MIPIPRPEVIKNPGEENREISNFKLFDDPYLLFHSQVLVPRGVIRMNARITYEGFIWETVSSRKKRTRPNTNT